MKLPNRKLWPIRLRETEVDRVKAAAYAAEERPCTWARQVLLREAARVMAREADHD